MTLEAQQTILPGLGDNNPPAEAFEPDNLPASGAPIEIEIAGPPVAKGRGKVGYNPHLGRAMVYTPAHTKKYENLIRQYAGDAMNGRAPLLCPVIIEVTAFLSIPTSMSEKRKRLAIAGRILPITRPDADNYLKSALDGLNQIVFRDDSQAVDVYIFKRYSERPRLKIKVTPVEVA